jgi:ADP-ribosylglycohydrolase
MPYLDQASSQSLSDALARGAELRETRTPQFIAPFTGCLLGTAVADALGLPYEGLSPRRAACLFPDPARYHFLPFSRGMCSDDTEHTVMVALALTETCGHGLHEGNAAAFRRHLACGLRLWLLGLPAGIGMATLKGILKLWLFVPPRWQGVWSAGNGPAMRSALIGLFWGGEHPELMRLHIEASTRLTHRDPKAAQAAFAVAVAAYRSWQDGGRTDPRAFAEEVRTLLGSEGAELAGLIERAAQSAAAGESTPLFAQSQGLGRGVTGYAFHTVPVALHAWLAHPGDYRGAVLAAIECGGDTDTVAAITGAIAGAGCGPDAIPAPWLEKLAEAPRDVAWMRALGLQLAKTRANYIGLIGGLPAVGLAALAWRQAKFLLVVLLHGFRRLLPPY